MAAYHVVWECVVEQRLGVRRTTFMRRITKQTVPQWHGLSLDFYVPKNCL